MNFLTYIRKPFRYEFLNAALIIIGANLLVFLWTFVDPEVSRYLSLNPLLVLKGQMYWQVFTYQFVHGGIGHLLSNMIGLLFFGIAVERKVGSKEFILLYLLSGTLCGAFSLLLYVLTGTWAVFLMGASGAVFAILLAYAVLFPRSVIYVWGILPIPAPLLILGYVGLEVFNIIAGANQGVAHSTHLIGFAVGWVYFLVRFNINPLTVWSRGR
jgi:membrane associated rhomboid family serine protease